jgi:hypothetical protein
LRISRRVERLVADRIAPLILIVLVPLLITGYLWHQQNGERRTKALIAACERANEIRNNQRVVLETLLEQAVLLEQYGTGDDELRVYLEQIGIPNVRAALARIEKVDCESAIR